jgi:tetratricopeptide (TPR) repeat protein
MSARVRMLRAIGAAAVLSALAAAAGTAQAAAPSRQQYIDFSENLAKELNKGDAAAFMQRFDRNDFANRVVEEMHVAPARHAMASAFARRAAGKMGQVVVSKLGQAGQLKFLRLQPAGRHAPRGAVTSLFRVDFGDKGLNYLQFQLQGRTPDRIRVVDWTNYTTGTSASEGMGDLFNLMLGPDPMPATGAGQGAGARAGNRWVLMGFLSAARKGHYETALSLFDALPQWMQRDRYLQINRMEAAKEVGGDTYRRVLAELVRNYGGDTRMSLSLVDYYIFTKDYARAHALIDQVSKMIGGDAALEALHANIDYRAGHMKSAIVHCRRAIQEDPDYEDSYWTVLNVLVKERHYQDAVLVLRILHSKFRHRLDPKAVAKVAGFTEFAKSEAFQAWAQN